MSENSYSIPLYSSDVKFEIRSTNFRKAEYYGKVFSKDSDEHSAETQYAINKFYSASGIKFVMEALINKRPLEDKIFNAFVEIITIASTIKEEKITSFMGILENPTDGSGNKFKENVDKKFQDVIKQLESERNLLTYKQNFFLQPEKPLAFIYLTPFDETERDSFSISVPENSSNNSVLQLTSSKRINNPSLDSLSKFKQLQLINTPKKVANSNSSNCQIWLKKELIVDRAYDKIKDSSKEQKEDSKQLIQSNCASHAVYRHNFLGNKNTPSALLSIPFISSAGVYDENKINSNDSEGRNPKFQGYGALFLFIEFHKIDRKNETDEQYKEKLRYYEEILKESLEDFAREVAMNVGKFAVNYLFETAKDLHGQTQRKARQAAIAQVMLRNMSHNIGSHVLSRMVTNETATGYQRNGQYKPFKGLISESKIKYADLAWFNSYLKTRMDFLADIATSVPVMEDTRMLLAEVITGLDRNRILLNNISGVENFNYSICVKDCRTEPNSACDPLIATGGKDIPIAMPNDILGFHALYIILENIIRNTAKHGNRPENDVVFTLEVRSCEKDDSLYEVWLYDNCVMKQVDGEDGNSGETKSLVQRLKEQIDSKVLDSTNSLRQGAWGMIEMKVSAAYLRKIAVGDIDEKKYKLFDQSTTLWKEKEDDPETPPSILKAESTTNKCLAYVFHLMKPKQLIVVDEKGTLYDELNKDTPGKKSNLGLLKEHGIWVLHKQDGRAGDNKFDAEVTYPHPFMLIIADGEFREETYLKKDGLFRSKLPPRLLVVTDSDNTKSDSWWVVQVKETRALLNAIKEVRATSETPTKADDFENATIINLIWREWLKSKLDLLKLSGIYSKIGETYISSAFNNYVLPSANGREPNFSFVLDHHGQNLNSDGLNKDHFEAYPSLVKPTLNRCSPAKKNPNFDKDELCKVVEGMLTKILIIDERVQQAYQSDYYPDVSSNTDIKPIKKEILYRAANIHIPQKDRLDLNRAEFEKNYKERLFEEVKRVSEESKFTGIDYIIIHLGVIEKILAATGQDKKEENVLSFVQDLVTCEGANGNARIVITSGRGKPDNLPDKIPFMAYSVLSQYAIEVPFKSYLTQSVSATRLAGIN